MSLRLNFNIASVRSQLSLQVADRLLNRSTERLSSGVRINRSADDPSGLTIANTMRYQVKGLETATDNVENGINMIAAGEGAMDEVMTILNRIRGLAVSAANEGAQDFPQLQALQGDLEQALSSLNRIADNTQFGDIKLLNGNLAGNTFDRSTLDSRNLRAVDYYESLTQDYRVLQDGIIPNTTMSVGAPSGDLNRSQLTVDFGPLPVSGDSLIQGIEQNGEALSAASGESIVIEGPRGALTIAIDGDTTIGKIRDRINGNSERTGVRADFDPATGSFTLESTVFGAAPITVTSSNDMSGGSDIALFTTDSTDPSNNSLLTLGDTQTISLTYEDRNGTQIISLVQDFDLADGRGFRSEDGGFTLIMRDTSDGSMGSTISAPDITYTATRKNSDRVMLGAQQGQHTLIDIPDMHSRVLGQNNGTTSFRNLSELGSENAFTTGRAQDALRVIDTAIEQVGRIRGSLGALQASSLESTINYLRINTENLTSAESRIRDTDFAKEAAEFAKQQTLLQAATSMLAQANQTPNRVIQLLGQ